LSEVVAKLVESSNAESASTPEDAGSLDQALEQAVEAAEGSDTTSNDFDSRLLEGLDAPSDPPAGEDLGQPSERDPLSMISERMGNVARRIRDDETLQPAQQIQQDILRELKSLAEQAAQQSQQQASRATSTPRPSQEGNDKPGSATDSATGSPRDVDPIEAVWGTLPERVRHGIRSTLHEEFLPEYEQIIREYYKRLAEQKPLWSER
jgi:hypothetical protein